ncbi:hypothetical protein V6R21_21400 [Limibacter armeniacum]|uniref:hypothetical protein n=1 Tax=Limibacter armeniacum TaxID=466084 RepID=UPI002FE5684F
MRNFLLNVLTITTVVVMGGFFLVFPLNTYAQDGTIDGCDIHITGNFNGTWPDVSDEIAQLEANGCSEINVILDGTIDSPSGNLIFLDIWDLRNDMVPTNFVISATGTLEVNNYAGIALSYIAELVVEYDTNGCPRVGVGLVNDAKHWLFGSIGAFFFIESELESIDWSLAAIGSSDYTAWSSEFDDIACAGGRNKEGISILKNFAAERSGSSSVNFSWNATGINDITNFSVDAVAIHGTNNIDIYDPDNGSTYDVITTSLSLNQIAAGAITFTDNNIGDPDTRYYIISLTLIGNGGASVEAGGGSGCVPCEVSIASGEAVSGMAYAPLPVDLIFFSTKNQSDGTLLYWATAFEISNSHFEIERSSDGKNYERIGTVQGYGFSESRVDYEFLDEAPFQGLTTYYRLKQVDYNGRFEYFPLIVRDQSEGDFTVQNLSGNPIATNKLKLQVHSPIAQSVIFKLVGMNGVVHYAEEKQVDVGSTLLTIDIEKVTSDMLILQVISKSKQETLKLMKY